MQENLEEIKNACAEADLILVGIGERFSYNWDLLTEQEAYRALTENFTDDDRWIVPFLQKMALDTIPDKPLQEAYGVLRALLNNKCYFIVSTATDGYALRCGLQAENIVTPCGGFSAMQCDENCSGEIWPVPEDLYADVCACCRGELPKEALTEPVCEHCGRPLRFNQMGVSRYAEEGYLPQWEVYTKWLARTLNKKLCILELGVGMEYPSVIRWPFERIVTYNQKAFLYRIHPSLYQLDAQAAERGKSIAADPVSFLQKGLSNNR